ncbi:MAG: DUF2851 family protein [Bacteroidia bacterium]|nr:DUF2851 family protein [Bacteroidia bacterium]
MPLFVPPEAFIHFVWRTLRLELGHLRTTAGELVEIITPGRLNTDQGPDFLEAQVRIEGVRWVGAVEMHIHSREWVTHGHHLDPRYNAVILHVTLYPGTEPVQRADGTVIPELGLTGLIPDEVYRRYNQLQLAETEIPCEALIGQADPVRIRAWLDRMTAERIEQQAAAYTRQLASLRQDWAEGLWQALMGMMGGPINRDGLEELARRMPYRILQGYLDTPEQTEALLFGAAGWLAGQAPDDPYMQARSAQWDYLRHKHQLPAYPPLLLHFHRMRPPAFPTLRIAQMAALLAVFPRLTDLLYPANWPRLLQADIRPTAYWDTRYRPGPAGNSSVKSLGMSQKEILLTNVLAPLSALYHQAHGREDAFEAIEAGLTALSPEDNRHTRPFVRLGLPNPHAWASQGMIQLKKAYCDTRRCLDCGIGHQLLRGK